jgi:hypothetical protein
MSVAARRRDRVASMPGRVSFDLVPIWLVFAGTFACVLFAVEAGFRLGR